MLLRFSVTNFLSIRDQAEVSFVATALKELPEEIIPSRYARHGVLPVLAVYGANASGKSNLLFALSCLRSLVLDSFTKADDNEGLVHRPFMLDLDNKARPTTFVIDFVINDTRYQFGVSFTAEVISNEWLYAFPKQVQQVLYSRDTAEPDIYYFGRGLTGSNRQIQSITRPSSLFLSAAAKSGHPLLSEIHDFFRNKIRVQRSNNAMPGETIAKRLEDDPVLQSEAAKYLAIADTGVVDIKIEKTPITDSVRGQITQFLEVFSKISGAVEIPPAPDFDRSIKLGHLGGEGVVHYLAYGDESLGTKYLLSLLPAMLSTLKLGGLLVLDEITTSLHTLLAKKLVMAFKDRTVNTLGAQLIFSTHDTNLLSPGVMRRDEIIFAEKSREGATSIFPLTDLKTKNTDNIERGYIQGRFGAVPYIAEETGQ